jgi:hypothetical protein
MVNLDLCPRCHTGFTLRVDIEGELGCFCGWRPTREICHVCGCFGVCEGHYPGMQSKKQQRVRRIDCVLCGKGDSDVFEEEATSEAVS